MLNINQNAVFGTALNSSNQFGTIINSRGVSVLTSGGTTTIATLDANGVVITSLTLPNGNSIEINADGGNLLQTIKVTPNASASAYIVSLGGKITIES
jgi:hypothetical protein